MQAHHRKLHGLLAAGVLLACFLLTPLSLKAVPRSNMYVPNEIIVKLRPSVDIGHFVSLYGLTVIDQLEGHPIYRLQIQDGVVPPLKATLLQEMSTLVVYAEPNYLGQVPENKQHSSWAAGYSVGDFNTQWAPSMIRLSEAHVLSRGAGTIVAVLDTGVDRKHPALAGRLLAGFDFVDLDADPSEEGREGIDRAYGHGTHVAGLVALVAPAASIMPIRILKPDGSGHSWFLAEGLRYAAVNGADVINLSYTFKQAVPSKLIDDILGEITCASTVGGLCDSAMWPGVVVTAAAGNSGPSTNKEYPAAQGTPGLLAVAASTATDTLASFSTGGSWVHVAAPGDRIVSSVPGNRYGAWSGTSMATPFVAGTAALIRAIDPNLAPAEVATRIKTTAASISGAVPRRLDTAAACRW